MKGRNGGSNGPSNGPLGVHHPALRPIWVRIAIVTACLGWGGVELRWGSPVWAVAIALVGGWLGHQFFIRFPHNHDTRH